jgi:hypothetical protein
LLSVNINGTCTYSLYLTYKCMTLMINYEIIIKQTIVSLLCVQTVYNFCVMKIKHIMYNVQDYSVLYNSAVLLVMREGWHFTYTHGKHFHDRIISLRGEVWFYKTSLIPAPFIKVPVRGHVFVCSGYRFCHFLRFSIWILKLFLQWDTLCSSY